jgi:hypothetical protein
MKHLFICVPNNSGSSLVHKLIAQSPTVATLPKEGQHIDGFAGPVPNELGVTHFYSENDVFAKAESYDWSKIRRVWEQYWEANNPKAAIRVEKSPPNVVRIQMLDAEFPEAHFVISWRNPYAMAEGILRNNPQAQVAQAGRHAINMMKSARENIQRYGDRSVVMSYEELTADPQVLLDRLTRLLPEIGPLSIDAEREILIKGYRYPGIRDTNAEQIANLPPWMIKQLNRIYERHADDLEHFGYKLLTAGAGTGSGFRPAPLANRSLVSRTDPNAVKPMVKGDFNYFRVGDYEAIEEFVSLVQEFDTEWNEMTYRQDQYGPHIDTRTIPILWVWTPKFDVVHPKTDIKLHHGEWFKDHISALEDHMVEHYGPGYFLRLILTRLPPDTQIARHFDSGYSFSISHRVHMAIITDPEVKFIVNDVEKVMYPGVLWEINNFRSHEVKNGSQIDRIHLIGDWYNPDEGSLRESMVERFAARVASNPAEGS